MARYYNDLRLPSAVPSSSAVVKKLYSCQVFRRCGPAAAATSRTTRSSAAKSNGFVTVGTPDSLIDRKSTRLNSSHLVISYAVFCLKKKKSNHLHLLNGYSTSQDETLD